MTIKDWFSQEPGSVARFLKVICILNGLFAVLLLFGLYTLNQHAAALEKQTRQINAKLANLDGNLSEIQSDIANIQEDVEDMANLLDSALGD